MDRKLKASELKLEARRLLAGKYGTSAGMLVVVFLLSILGSIAIFFPLIPAIFGAWVPGRMNEGWIFGGLAVFFFMTLLVTMVGYVVTAGICRFFYNICTGQAYEIGDLLYGFKNKWWRFVGLGFLYAAVNLAAGIPGPVVEAAANLHPWASWLQVLSALFTLLHFAVTFVLYLFFGQAIYILVESREEKVFAALGESVRLMRGNKLRYIYLSLSFTGVYVLTFLSFGIGYLWVLPYIYTTYILFYLDLKR